MKYNCSLCDYKTDDKSNFNRHMNANKHRKNVREGTEKPKKYKSKQPVSTVKASKNKKTKIYNCDKCGLEFSHSSSASRHKRVCNEKIEIGGDTKILNQRLNVAETQNKQLAEQNERLWKMLENSSNRINDDGSTIKSSLSSLNYLITKCKKTPPLKELTHEGAQQILGYNGDITMIEKIVRSYRNKNISRFLGSIIAKCYKTKDPKDQSIWNTDVSRLTYIIRDIIGKNGQPEWVMDKKGIRVGEYIIQPVLNFIVPLIEEYIGDIHKKNKIEPNINNQMNNLRYMASARELLLDISLGKIEKDISRYLSAHLQFNKMLSDDPDKSSDDSISLDDVSMSDSSVSYSEVNKST